MNGTRKRVSFGSHGSMVETLIIDEMPVTKEQRNFYNQNILQMEQSNKTMESQDNPFQPDGDLSKEVEMMLKRSTISRTQVLIGDKDNPQPVTNDNPEPTTKEAEAVSEPVVQATPAVTVSSEKPETAANDVAKPNTSTNEIKPKENGKVDETTSPQQVDVKVMPEDGNKDNAPENKGESPSESEKPKKARGKCCSIM